MKLKSGMFIKNRRGQYGVVVGDKVVYKDYGYDYVTSFTDSLKNHNNFTELDIIAVYCNTCFNTLDDDKVIWKEEEEILDEVEKEYLKSFLKPFNVKHIIKRCIDDAEWLGININTEYFELPAFKAGTMYVGMKPNRQYTLKELGIEK